MQRRHSRATTLTTERPASFDEDSAPLSTVYISEYMIIRFNIICSFAIECSKQYLIVCCICGASFEKVNGFAVLL